MPTPAKKARPSAKESTTATKPPARARARKGDDWEAAKEILAAHRTLARAERRETDVSVALKAHGKSIDGLRAAIKKASRQLDAAQEDLSSSVRARKKAADRLAALEKRTASGKKN